MNMHKGPTVTEIVCLFAAVAGFILSIMWLGAKAIAVLA